MKSADGWAQDWREAVLARGALERPFVTAAFALSSDGCLSGRKGRSTALSSRDALLATHLLRSMHDAILVGRGTVAADDPLLTTRLVEGPTGHRVVLDSELRTPATARLLKTEERPVVFFGVHGADPSRAESLRAAGAEVEHLEPRGEGVDLKPMLARLRARGVRTLMVEGGAQVLESFFAAGLVDYVSCTQAPVAVAGPESVRLGAGAVACLAQWPWRREISVGVDRLAFGRFFE